MTPEAHERDYDEYVSSDSNADRNGNPLAIDHTDCDEDSFPMTGQGRQPRVLHA